jgi:5-formyltetrahydrofolate cyclo-ligase
MLTKPELRQDIVSKCRLLGEAYRHESFSLVLDHVIPLVKQSQSIAIYHAYDFEFDLSHIIKLSYDLHKTLYHPIAYRKSKIMRFAKVTTLNPPIFSAEDDEVVGEIEWYNIDLVLVPLVAVSLDGHRLGKGGGYYDATFKDRGDKSTIAPILCGVGFDLQLVDELPIEPWDIKLDYFVSEKRIIKF